MGARETALNALIACRRDGAWVNTALKDTIARDRLNQKDAGLATRLCYGVVQNRLKLDFYLDQLLQRKGSLHPVVRDILHLGLYQLYALDKIPDSAAVNESVALTKKYCKNPKAPSLVNGVLRSAVRSRGQLKEPVGYAEKYSHPEQLITLLKRNLPKGTLEPMLIADNEAPETTIQVNTLRIPTGELKARLEARGVQAEAHGWMEDCLVLSGTGNLENLPEFREGLFYVQDPAARLSVLCAQLPRENIRVLDCCAAPGGKSFAAAIAMGGRGTIDACDIYPHKTALIESGARRLGFDSIAVHCQDASESVPDWVGSMDAVIVDVPCSGLGIIRKKPDIRYKDIEKMKALPQLQYSILENQARYVKPGGVLLYSTCTLVWEENEGMVERFLKEHPQFHTEPLPLPGNFSGGENGMLVLVPGEYDTDGFFICRLRRNV